MKYFFLLIILIIPYKTFALNADVFGENFPSFQDQQQSAFDKLRSYFELLPISSQTSKESEEIISYQFKNTTIFSKIARTFSPSSIVEEVSYSVINGSTFLYRIKKSGNKITPTPDYDLLTFNFKQSDEDESYQIVIPLLNIEMNYLKKQTGEKDIISLGFMGFSMSIESNFKEHDALLSYIFFFSLMPDPQIAISVKATEITSGWGDVDYTYYSSNTGEITPKQFFKGLNDSSSVFTSTSDVLYKLLMSLGFPKLN